MYGDALITILPPVLLDGIRFHDARQRLAHIRFDQILEGCCRWQAIRQFDERLEDFREGRGGHIDLRDGRFKRGFAASARGVTHNEN